MGVVINAGEVTSVTGYGFLDDEPAADLLHAVRTLVLRYVPSVIVFLWLVSPLPGQGGCSPVNTTRNTDSVMASGIMSGITYASWSRFSVANLFDADFHQPAI